ncbi:histidine phosphatase family protein [Kutzneria kofuensis]|uniref:2,3-bisphosphoglycerate-dependent phosphoglycerate mutase n=1 Tax=Kutzneria kofuensis TaxID=103725 RepID=A0A7W9NJ22_9PSEU|nr:histidine phosphatase family protein [Kutzneria kofuensis]MBB5894515.1 2,3-bisphosphoglycerate-dependent phosphoglycerate mutase [Kutzneria kofuensis]
MRADIVLVRHAHPVYPSPGGPDDYHRPLDEIGLAQAEDLVEELAAMGPTLIASSPYLRAVQTIEPLARTLGLPIRTDQNLREWDSGVGPTPDYARYYEESWADPDFARPGGESLNQLTARATAALRELAENQGTVVIGSHGTILARALIGFGLTTVDWPFSKAMPMPAVYRITGTKISGPGL